MSRMQWLGLFLMIILSFQGLLGVLFFRLFNREWWRRRWVKWSVWLLPLAGIAFVIVWGLGDRWRMVWLSKLMAGGTSLVAILQLSLILSLIVSGLVNGLNWVLEKIAGAPEQRSESAAKFHDSRRTFLKRAAIIAPAATMTLGVAGMVRSYSGVNVYRRRVSYPNLPPQLDGLRILHLSDLHLRYYVTLEDLEPVLRDAEPFRPDLVLVTGDIADDLGQLPEALSMIDQLKAPLGTYASLGNHEHFRGVEQVRRIFDRSTVPLLVDDALVVKKGDTRLLVSAIDDPVHMRHKDLAFYRSSIDYVLERSAPYDFSVLMSHRPDALDHASERELDLVLAGHTHGGQMGLLGRSVFEPVWPDRYLWGHYRMKKTQLYTSSGVGHWFPFRLGCPPEAPVIELHRG